MVELFRETDLYLRKELDTYNSKINYTKIGIWWSLWILIAFLNRISTKLNSKVETIEDLNTVTLINIVIEIIYFPLTILIITIIKEYHTLEIQLFNLKDSSEKKSDEIVDIEPNLIKENLIEEN